jgi:hypothetical protein
MEKHFELANHDVIRLVWFSGYVYSAAMYSTVNEIGGAPTTVHVYIFHIPNKWDNKEQQECMLGILEEAGCDSFLCTCLLNWSINISQLGE